MEAGAAEPVPMSSNGPGGLPQLPYRKYQSYREALFHEEFLMALPFVVSNWREIRDYDPNWKSDIRAAIRDGEWPTS